MPDSILIADRYYRSSPNDWAAFTAAAGFNGAILKATDGVSLPDCEQWFVQSWEQVRGAAGDRYGRDFFRGAYHYLEFFDDGAAQAEHYLDVVEQAGGWQPGDLWPIVDVERGRTTSRNFAADGARVEDCVDAFAATIRQQLGPTTPLVLYAGGVFRDLGINLAGTCSYLWAARYGHQVGSFEAYGWPDEKIVLWQYTDGTYNYTGQPSSAPGLGASDLSVYRPGDLATLRRTLIRAGE
jgi:GH25 family lysozyme M1 (1,4-beta-N-acetylmuramidase)